MLEARKHPDGVAVIAVWLQAPVRDSDDAFLPTDISDISDISGFVISRFYCIYIVREVSYSWKR